MSLLKSKKFHGFLGFAVSIALLVWSGMGLDWQKVGEGLKSVHYLAFLPCILLLGVHYTIRGLRWRYLLPPVAERPAVRTLVDASMVGNLATFILPFRAGEFIRPYVLSLKSSYSFSTGFSSVVIERFFDLSAVLATFGIMVQSVPNMPSSLYHGAYLLTVLGAILLVFMIVGSFLPEPMLKLGEMVLKPFPSKIRVGVLKLATDFLAGASVLRRPGNLVLVVVLTSLVWITNYWIYYLYFHLVGIEPTIWLALAVAVILALAVAAPSMPGFIGPYQFACIVAFGLFGLSEEVAMTYAIVTHLFQYVVVILYGGLVLIRYNVSLGELKNKSGAA